MQVHCPDVLSTTMVFCVVACCIMLYWYSVINQWCFVLEPAALCCSLLHSPYVMLQQVETQLAVA